MLQNRDDFLTVLEARRLQSLGHRGRALSEGPTGEGRVAASPQECASEGHGVGRGGGQEQVSEGASNFSPPLEKLVVGNFLLILLCLEQRGSGEWVP